MSDQEFVERAIIAVAANLSVGTSEADTYRFVFVLKLKVEEMLKARRKLLERTVDEGLGMDT